MARKIIVGAQVIFIMLFVCEAYGQDRFENINKRAQPFESLILAAADRHEVDPNLLWTIAYLESGFRPHAISYKDREPCAFGLMQFTPATARRFNLTNPLDPRESVDAAARYVRYLWKFFDGRGDLVLAGYNAGEGTVQAFREGRRLILPSGKIINPREIRTGGIPPYKETRNYVAQGYLIYQRIVRQQRFSDARKALPLSSPVRQNSPKDSRAEASMYSSDAILHREPGVYRQTALKTEPFSIYPN
jgi:soluble lytic murein transglycosylase-like protein